MDLQSREFVNLCGLKIQVFSGPPTVAWISALAVIGLMLAAWLCLCRKKQLQSEVVFKWRHFGKYTGVFTDKHGKKYKGNGKMLSDLTE